MEVILTRPNYKTHLITPPLGIGYLSSYLKSKKINCEIIDGLNLNLENEEIIRRCQRADIVGISVLSYYFLKAIDLVDGKKLSGFTWSSITKKYGITHFSKTVRAIPL